MASPCPNAESSGPFKDVARFPGRAWPCANAGSSRPFKNVARFPGRTWPGGNAGSSRPFKDVARFPLILCSDSLEVSYKFLSMIRQLFSSLSFVTRNTTGFPFLDKKYHRSFISQQEIPQLLHSLIRNTTGLPFLNKKYHSCSIS